MSRKVVANLDLWGEICYDGAKSSYASSQGKHLKERGKGRAFERYHAAQKKIAHLSRTRDGGKIRFPESSEEAGNSQLTKRTSCLHRITTRGRSKRKKRRACWLGNRTETYVAQ